MRLILLASMVILSSSLLVSCTTPRPVTEASTANTKLRQATALNTQLALNYIAQDNLVLAKEKLVAVLQQRPNYSFANIVMAYYLERTGNIKNAELYYLKAIRTAAIKGAAENNYGTFLCRQRRYQQAEKHFHRAIADKRYVNTAKVYENAGLCAQRGPHPGLAIGYFESAVQHDPNLVSARLVLAKLHYTAGHYTQAYAQLKTYLLMVKSPAADILYLAIRLAYLCNDFKAVHIYGLRLQQQFPTASAYWHYQQWQLDHGNV